MAETDHNCLSLDDFWHEHSTTEYRNGCYTSCRRIVIDQIKSEEPLDIVDVSNELDSSDDENVFVSYDCNAEFVVERYVWTLYFQCF